MNIELIEKLNAAKDAQPLFLETRFNEINGSVYSANYFYTQSGISYSCREEFASHFTRETEHFYYLFENHNNIERFAKEIAMVEFVLGVNDNRLRIERHSTKNNFIKIYVGPYWRNNPLRRQFLTAFLKSIAAYPAFNIFTPYESIYFSTKGCTKAYYNFLSGNTFMEKKAFKDGWVNTFNSEVNVNKMLNKSAHLPAEQPANQ